VVPSVGTIKLWSLNKTVGVMFIKLWYIIIIIIIIINYIVGKILGIFRKIIKLSGKISHPTSQLNEHGWTRQLLENIHLLFMVVGKWPGQTPLPLAYFCDMHYFIDFLINWSQFNTNFAAFYNLLFIDLSDVLISIMFWVECCCILLVM